MSNMFKKFARRVFNAPGWETREGSYPDSSQWSQFFKALTGRERIIVGVGSFLLISGLLIAGLRAYDNRTDIVATAGGSVTIGVVGAPLYINPVLAPSNAADSDLARLIFAGLFRYDGAGNLVPDLAASYAIGDFGKVIEVELLDNIVWPDGQPFTADDVLFTIDAVQDPTIRSPLHASWIGVNVEVIDATNIRFTLPSPYPPFLHNLTLGILSRSTWEEVAPENFALSEQNIKPMGLGPFRPKTFDRSPDGRILAYTLERNPSARISPLLEHVTLRFFNQHQEALVAFNRGEVQLLGPILPTDTDIIRSGHSLTTADLPRTFGVFINQANSKVLADDNVRLALAHATWRDPIMTLLGGPSFAVGLELPIPDSMFGATKTAPRFGFNIAEALGILDDADWQFPKPEVVEEDEDVGPTEAAEPPVPVDPIRENDDGEPFTFVLTHRDDARSSAIVKILQAQWELLGATVELRPLGVGAYRKAIIERSYESILAGEELPLDPDLFAFWHSSQKFDPGGNLALFESPSVDAILEKGRESFVVDEREQLYQDAQKLIMEDAPVIFLWSERYSFAADTGVSGVDFSLLANPSWRFGNVTEWYVRTKRIWIRN